MNYNGETFVAFLDISGFKELMKNKKALEALKEFYGAGYDLIKNDNETNQIKGIFVSDSGILFIDKNPAGFHDLKTLLKGIKKINQKMLNENFMITTSIAYGEFKYSEMGTVPGIEKNPLYGEAYTSAFLDNENEKPKIQPGQCRIITETIPESIKRAIKENEEDEIFKMIQNRKGDDKHCYYYWMREDSDEIEEFEKDYKDTYNLKFKGMLEALKS